MVDDLEPEHGGGAMKQLGRAIPVASFNQDEIDDTAGSLKFEKITRKGWGWKDFTHLLSK